MDSDRTLISRRSFLGAGAALAGAVAALDPLAALADEAAPESSSLAESLARTSDPLASASIAELQQLLVSGRLTSLQLVELYRRRIRRIDRGLGLNSVLELNPDAERIARARDRERARGVLRGPLHGIPILVKDNIDTGDRMQTTAGSLALLGDPALRDATAVAKLRRAGAVVLGKTNLSEWANFRGFHSSSGWSGVGGQTNHPFVLDRNPGGSSSGSAAAVAAGLCAAALGTETDGSIVYPAGTCGVVGIKPTVGLTSRAGIVPISSTQDSVGVHGRCVADAAAVLGALTGVDARDPATARSAGLACPDYLQFLDRDGLRGARIGVPREIIGSITQETDAAFETALRTMQTFGAEVVDVVLPSFAEFRTDPAEIIILLVELKRTLNAYLATRRGLGVPDLDHVIQFNLAYRDVELVHFGQQYLVFAQDEAFDEVAYQAALLRGRALAASEGIDAALQANALDALVAPTNTPAWPTDLVAGDYFVYSSSTYSAVAGYPIVTLPMSSAYELPIGISFLGTAYSEPMLIRLASAFEAAAAAMDLTGPGRPGFLRSVPDGTRATLRAFQEQYAGMKRLPYVFDPQLPTPPVEPVRIFGELAQSQPVWPDLAAPGVRRPRAI